MVVWASILQSTADIRHLYRFAKEIHQKKAKSMVFQYSKYLVDFNGGYRLLVSFFLLICKLPVNDERRATVNKALQES